ncbi:MAG: glutamate racemase [Bacteriovoracaceae bacterium]|jgi:L-alanine-DL-glutamate epimerase-like enolase superfamily enzyme
MSYQLKKMKLELRVNWKISRNESLFKDNFILTYNGFESEVAPNIRYGETVERIEKEFQELLVKPGVVQSTWCNSFQNAVNNVFLKEQANGDIYSFLKLKKLQKVKTSFSIPMMEVGEIEKYLAANKQFQIYKLKISGLKDFPLLDEVCKNTTSSIRIDANEGFSSLEEYLKFEKLIENLNIEFIEQPFKSSMEEDYRKLKSISKFPIIADESIEDDFDGELFALMFHGINVKLMKAGGIHYGLRLIKKGRAYGLKTMIGCMIESSLGISEAYTLASLCDYCDLDGALLTSNDPYRDLFDLEDGYLKLK